MKKKLISLQFETKLVIKLNYNLYIAVDKGWTNLWLEFDSSLVNLAFAKPEMAPWDIRNR